MPTLDILIPSVTSRHELLQELLTHLWRQMLPGVGVRVYRDNLEVPIGDKFQRLIESSSAEYVCAMGDDDWVSDDYIPSLMAALEQRPDYVGFKSHLFEDGVFQQETVESLKVALPSTLCPMRRVLARRVAFEGGIGEDRRWATQIAALELLRSEVFVDKVMYLYRHSSTDSCQNNTIRPYAGPVLSFRAPWLTWLL